MSALTKIIISFLFVVIGVFCYAKFTVWLAEEKYMKALYSMGFMFVLFIVYLFAMGVI